tara:strand:+ start:1085 stop:1279 length:195 start_codon:yes stop_codon:yes gene_type:complete
MTNKLRPLKGAEGKILVGGKMPKTLKDLGITPEQLLRLQAKGKTKGKTKSQVEKLLKKKTKDIG